MIKTLDDLEKLFRLMNAHEIVNVQLPDGTKVSTAFSFEEEEGPVADGIGFSARSDEDDEDDPSPEDSAIKSPYEHPALPVRAPFPGQPAGFSPRK